MTAASHRAAWRRRQGAAAPFVVAVTGHRDPHPDDVAWVQAQAARTIALVAAARPHGPIHFLSALANGADQLFASQVLAMQRGASGIGAARLALLVALPMALDDYCAAQGGDAAAAFKARWQCYAAAAHGVLHLPVRRNGDAYVHLAQYMVRHADLVIAIWDGRTGPADIYPRKPGGTLDVVLRALEARPSVSSQTGSGDAGAPSVLHIYCRRAQGPSQSLPAARSCAIGPGLLTVTEGAGASKARTDDCPRPGSDAGKDAGTGAHGATTPQVVRVSAPSPQWPGVRAPSLPQWLGAPRRAATLLRRHLHWRSVVRATQARLGRRLDGLDLAVLYRIHQDGNS